MLLTVKVARNQEINPVEETDRIVRLSHVSFSESKAQKGALFAIFGDQKFLIAGLDSAIVCQAKVRVDFISSQKIKLVAEGADLNVFGFVHNLDDMFEQEESLSAAFTDENESESELEMESVRPVPPSNWEAVMRAVELQKSRGQMAAVVLSSEPKRQKAIQKKKHPKKEPVKLETAREQTVGEEPVRETKQKGKGDGSPAESRIPNVNAQLSGNGLWGKGKKHNRSFN